MKKLKIQTSKLALGNSCRFFASTYLGLTLLTKYSERYFSTSTVPVLDPFYITGLVDGEGSWALSINKDSKRSLGYIITVVHRSWKLSL